MKKVIIIGAEGEIGRLITPSFRERFEVVTVGRSSGDIRVDIADASSVERLFVEVKDVEHVISVAGDTRSAAIDKLTLDDLAFGLKNKLLSQIGLVIVGQKYLPDGGSITLTSGIMGDHPKPGTIGKAFVNGGLHSFVKGAAVDLGSRLRVNVVSPPKMGLETDKDVIAAYLKAVESNATGEVFRIY